MDKAMELSLIVSAVDHATNVVNRVKAGLSGLDGTIRKVAGSTGASRLSALGGLLGTLGKGAFLGAVGAGAAVGLHRAFEEAVELDATLMRIVNTGELSIDKFQGMRDELTRLSGTLGVTREELAAGLGDFVAGGMDPEKAMRILPVVGRAYAVYGGQVQDYTSGIEAAMRALKMEDPGAILETMVRAGKDGKLEVRDQARALPTLAAKYAALGSEGRSALASISAAHQAVFRATGNAEGTVTNMTNLMSKLASVDVTKNFEKAGISSPFAIWQNAIKNGNDPLFELAQVLKDKGFDRLDKLKTIVVDEQAGTALLGLMQNMDFYRETLERSLKASGQLKKDGENIDKTFGQRWKVFRQTLTGFLDTAIAPWLGRLNELMVFLNKNTWLVKAGVSAIMAGLVAGPVLGTVGKLTSAFGFLSTHLASLGVFTKSFGVGKGLLEFVGAYGGGVGSMALNFGRMLPMLGPIGLKLALIAGIGALMYKAFKPFFDGFGRGFMDSFSAELPVIRDLLGQVGDSVRDLVVDLGNLAGELFGGGEAWGDYATGLELGRDLGQAAAQQIKNAVGGLVILVGTVSDLVFVLKTGFQQALQPLAMYAEFASVLSKGGSFKEAWSAAQTLGESMNKQRAEDMEARGDKNLARARKAVGTAQGRVPREGDPYFNGPVQPRDRAGEAARASAAGTPQKGGTTHQGDIMPITVNVSGGADPRKTADEVVAAVRARARDLVPILEQAGLVLARKQA